MKRIKLYFESLNLSYKKELSLFLITNLCLISMAIVTFILLSSILFLAVFLVVDVIANIVLMMRYSVIKDKILKSHENEFIYFIQYIEIFLSNNYNVYSALEAVKSFTSNWMQERIDELINDIDNDKSITPFINFAKNFKTPIVTNVMINIYQMVEQGEDKSRLQQFDLLFVRFFENHQEIETLTLKKKMDNLSMYPLIGAGIITIMLIIGVVLIMEEMINVL